MHTSYRKTDPVVVDPHRPDSWTIQDAVDLYGIDAWGGGYFGANSDGKISVRLPDTPSLEIDLGEVINGLRQRGITTPVLLRFGDILEHRLNHIKGAFERAMRDSNYGGDYACIYPIKVNQQRHVCEEIRDGGADLGFGFEAGSKPELLAVLGMTSDHESMPIICNGFKDDEYIETVILAKKLGRNITPVVERLSELHLIVRHAERYNVRPEIGVRVKLTSRGAGRWEDSSGHRSKFGLTISELMSAVEFLRDNGMLDCLTLLHCHIGSQVCDIRRIKKAVTELAHIYGELTRLGAGMTTIDIGGGLGIDYDGTRTATESSLNYTLEEYAADVVHRIRTVCDDAEIPHPRIISESGRAMVAHASMLITEVVGTSRSQDEVDLESVKRVFADEKRWSGDVPQPLQDLLDAYTEPMPDDLRELYHDILAAREEIGSLFNLGYVGLPARSATERLFWALGRRLLDACQASNDRTLGEIAKELPELLSDIYFCNFSVFQSLTDGWALKQLFPMCPLQRLNERPTRRGILADITCDSLGQVDRFASTDGAQHTLALHELRSDEPYDIGIFLVGAYQETLGDLHNLFGDTHVVHIRAGEKQGDWWIDELIEGDSVREVLGYVQFDCEALRRSMRQNVERAHRLGRVTVEEGKSLLRFYEHALDGYTYLED